MANWNVLKAAIADVINTNGNQEITGQLLQNVLNNIVTSVGENATFAGIATLDTNPGAPDGPVFYLATTAGVYPNFNGIKVLDGEAVILEWNNSAWAKKTSGFATQEKLSEVDSETRVLRLVGDGANAVYSDAIISVKSGNIYRVWVKDTDIDLSGLTSVSSTTAVFGIIAYNGTNNYGVIPDVTKANASVLNDFYDVIIPDDYDGYKLRLFGRLPEGSELVCFVENITEFKQKKSVERGIFDTSNGTLVESNNRCRSLPIYFDEPNTASLYVNYILPSNMALTPSAAAYKGDVFVKKITHTAKRGSLYIPYDGTFDNIRVGFKKNDETDFTESEVKSIYTFEERNPIEVLNRKIEEQSDRIHELKEDTLHISEKTNVLQLRGGNEVMVFSNKYAQVKAGRLYRIVVKNPNINVSGISDDYFSGSYAAFSVVGSYDGGANYGLMPDVMLAKDVVLNNYYDVIIPDGIEYLYISGRWSSEYILTCFIEDITDVKISLPLTYGSFNDDTKTFVLQNDRVRTDKIRLSGEGNYFYINYKGDNLIPTANAILFKDEQFVGRKENIVKRGTIAIPNDGTFDSVVIIFKKEDGTEITNDERLSYKVYVNDPMTEMVNIDSPNQYIVKLQFELGGLGSSKGKPYGALRDETQTRISRQSLYMSFDGTYDTIVSELGSCTIYCYDHNFKFIYSVSAAEEIPSHTQYIKLQYNEILREKNIVVCSKKEPKLFKNGMYDEVYPRYVQLSYEADVPPIGDIDATMDYVGSNGTISWNNGYIMLPENYDSKGEPVPLIIFCHGTNGYLWSQDKEVKNYDEYVRFLCKNGYAVADCSTLTNVYANSGVRDINVSHSLSVECYCKLYKYIISHFNVKEDGAYIFGKSAGGLNSIVLSYLQAFPIKACGELAPSLDTFVNMRYITNYEDINWSFGKLGIQTDYTSSNPLISPTPEKIQYLIDNYKKTMGYNPMLLSVIGLDVDSFYNEVMSMNWSTFSYNANLMEIIAKASKIQNFPLKIWQALDDNATPIAMSKMYRDMVVNGGGICVLRELPAGCGQHHAVDYDVNAPRVDYLCKNGETINVPVAYAELVDWFNQW